MTIANFEALLDQLRPVADLKVMDLVEAAGVDVAPWSFKQGGESVRHPKANPAFCYEWAFGEGDEPIVLCVWHEALTPHPHGVAFEHNFRARATWLAARSQNQAKRCRAFDQRVQRAARGHLPLRVILLDGVRATKSGEPSSSASRRLLDAEAWFVHTYDEASGEFILVRGAPKEKAPGELFVDQLLAQQAARCDGELPVMERREHCGRDGFLTDLGHTLRALLGRTRARD